ncbi:hypothetical protein L3V79_03700 [Thiotrichales bacterium 19S9-12]|nr:hypothetical protein [Thiotrichales bacterium 19S9-11]MCF6811460.1 hypothetical protein [Thiotrichales bacterium 19S9-12]
MGQEVHKDHQNIFKNIVHAIFAIIKQNQWQSETNEYQKVRGKLELTGVKKINYNFSNLTEINDFLQNEMLPDLEHIDNNCLSPAPLSVLLFYLQDTHKGVADLYGAYKAELKKNFKPSELTHLSIDDIVLFETMIHMPLKWQNGNSDLFKSLHITLFIKELYDYMLVKQRSHNQTDLYNQQRFMAFKHINQRFELGLKTAVSYDYYMQQVSIFSEKIERLEQKINQLDTKGDKGKSVAMESAKAKFLDRQHQFLEAIAMRYCQGDSSRELKPHDADQFNKIFGQFFNYNEGKPSLIGKLKDENFNMQIILENILNQSIILDVFDSYDLSKVRDLLVEKINKGGFGVRVLNNSNNNNYIVLEEPLDLEALCQFEYDHSELAQVIKNLSSCRLELENFKKSFLEQTEQEVYEAVKLKLEPKVETNTSYERKEEVKESSIDQKENKALFVEQASITSQPETPWRVTAFFRQTVSYLQPFK